MNLKITYPIPVRQNSFYRTMRNIVRIMFLTAAFVCVLLNIILKGKAWSLIVLWSLFSIWQLIFSLKLVEYSIFSHITYIFIDTIVLLWLIDRFLAPGWASTVIPIVFFAAMLTMFIIYFVTYDRKHRHLASMLVMGVLTLAAIPYYTHNWPIENWVAVAFQIASTVLFLILLIINWKDIPAELKVRFKIKNR